MYDVIVLGDITIDIYIRGEIPETGNSLMLDIGNKYVLDLFESHVGGGASNIAVGIANLGFDPAPLALIGENIFKQFIMQDLVRRSVSCEFLTFDPKYLNISIIYLTKSREKIAFHYPTLQCHFTINNAVLSKILATKYVYFGAMPNYSVLERITLAKHFQSNSVPIITNLSSLDCSLSRMESLQLVAISNTLIVNRYEFSLLLGNTTSNKLNLSQKSLYQALHCPIIIVTDAHHGVYAYYDDQVIFYPQQKANKVEDTTGAGDAFVAGFIASKLREETLENNIISGNQYALKIISQIGAH